MRGWTGSGAQRDAPVSREVWNRTAARLGGGPVGDAQSLIEVPRITESHRLLTLTVQDESVHTTVRL